MSVKYLWAKGPTGSFYFKRRVPLDIKHLVGKEFIQECLHTRDLQVAARKIHVLARKTNQEWEHLRRPNRASEIAQAQALLEEYGVDLRAPFKDDPGFDSFIDALEDKLPSYLRHHDTEVSDRDLAKHLSSVHLTALKMAQGRLEFLASDCLDLYLKMRPGTPQAEKTNRIPFTYLMEQLGNRDIRTYRRADANSLVRYMLEVKQIKTTTVERYITTLRAAWGLAIREREYADYKSPWESLEIPGLGKDAKERHPFTVPDYLKLYKAIGTPQDDLRCMVVLLAETGARLAEIVGLAADDCHPNDDIPYIHIRSHPWRPLKTAYSTRKVPLTPKAIDALKTALRLCKGSSCLFPRYADGKTTNATAASATLIKYVRTQGIPLTVHSLRHGMRDLLRAAKCPDSVARQLQGWASIDISDGYGQGYSLGAIRDWLFKATAALAH